MGCDWYKFKTVSGVGFRVTEEQYLVYKELLGPVYTGLLFSEWHYEGVTTYVFIYDKDTTSYNQIEVPGPYTIDFSDHCTEYTEQKKLVKFFQDKINIMKIKFDLDDEVCSYWSISTTMGVGEFELTICPEVNYGRAFSSVKEYREYYGYDVDVEEDEEDEEAKEDD
jgi:hypothetical protein